MNINSTKIYSMNTKSISFILIIGLFAGCQAPDVNTIPDDVDGVRKYIQDKKNEVRELNNLLADAQKKLGELDPSSLIKPKTIVTAMDLEKETFEHYVEIQGSVQAEDVVQASSEMGGVILSMNHKEGAYIRKGQLVATLNTETIDKQIQEIETSLDLANTVYEKQKRLWDQEIGSEIQYLQAKNNKERLEKSLETIRSQLKKANVYAPISGAVDMVHLKAGELAGPGTPIIQILNTSRVKVVTAVPESYLGSVKRNDLVTIRFPALNKEINARVSLLGRSIDPANRTFDVEVALPNKGGNLKPNLLAEMLLKDQVIEDAVILPMHLIQQEVGGKKYVMVTGQCENEQCAKKKYITTGPTYESSIVVESGLEGTEEIIVEGARSISENELIGITKESISNGETK